MTILTEGWKKWLQEHSTNANYNEIADKIKSIFNNASHTVNFFGVEASSGQTKIPLFNAVQNPSSKLILCEDID